MKLQVPSVSVVIPVYNTEKYLQKNIDSICNQTLDDIEIIIVNDGSIDSSGKIADLAATNDFRIKVIHQRNAHLSAARNTGLAHATGKYVLFIDSDDWIEPDMLRTMYAKAELHNMDVVISGIVVEYTKENRRIHLSVNQYIESVNRADLRSIYLELSDKKLFNYAWNKLYRTALIKEHCLSFDVQPPFEDEPFNMQVFMVAKNICVLPDLFYHYMRNDEMTIVASYKEDYLDAYKDKLAVYRPFFKSLALDTAWVDAFFSKSILQTYSVYIQSLYKQNAHLGRKKRIHIIRKDIYADLSLLKIAKQSKSADVYQKVFRYLLLNCSPAVTDFVYVFLFFFRYRLETVYRYFRKRNLN